MFKWIKGLFGRKAVPSEPTSEVAPAAPPVDAPRGRTGPEYGVINVHTNLLARHLRDGVEIGRREVFDRVVTNAGRDFIVDAFTNTAEVENFNYHESGTGTNAEAVGDTALQTPAPPARVTGTQSQPTSDVYRSVGTVTYTSSLAITEHGLFSAATAGTLLDRTVFTAINVANGDKIEFTFNITFASGG